MKKDKVNIFCYVGIGLFVLLIFIPPVLRLLFPKEEVIKTNYLACSKTETLNESSIKMTVITNYVNNKIKTLKITYNITVPENYNMEELYTNSTILKDITILKSIENVEIMNETDQNIVLKYDYSKSEFNNELINNYVKNSNLEIQKTDNLNAGFDTCNITGN